MNRNNSIHGRSSTSLEKPANIATNGSPKSLTRVPPTLVQLVRTMAVALLLLVFSYPFHHWLIGAACFVLFALVLFFANLVMTDTDNPFEGVCNISNEPFTELTQ